MGDASTRKTVSVLFSDVSGSTALGEQVDPEAMRAVMSRYFDAMRAVLEHHGGTVEKFIGDAVMAVFGVPELHEDDALRAVRAAAEMRRRLALLNDELERDHGVSIRNRTGVNTGEVVAGAGQTLVTGDAVNVAARLEQAAAPGEILIGPATQRLVRDAVLAEEVEPLELKGKSERTAAFRLVEVLPAAPAYTRALDTPFVGRERELEELAAAYGRARDERRCELLVVTGAAGIGKSRIAREFVARTAGEARVLVGRCLSYGDGITYWPLREVVEQLCGTEPRAELARLLESELGTADAILAATGFDAGTPQGGEVGWAVRRLLETTAAERPLVLVLDDLHWAEPALLDLVDYLRGFARDAPVLLLGTARPEILDTRPSWRDTAVALEPLEEAQARELAERLADRFAPARRERLVDVAEGNPLFLEQLIAADAEEDGGVPPTIQALLATRIDRLPPAEHAVAIRASVEGRQFHRGAVTALTPEELRGEVTSHLLALVRRELVRPDESLFAGDDGFRFAHALVRDAAYAAASKELRADLHERYSAWLENVAGERAGEFEEILGYHLAEAHRLRSELGPPDAHTRELGARAARLLGDAGRRALGRSDFNAARGLLERAIAAARDARYELDLAEVLLYTGEAARALELVERTSGDEATAARADLLSTYARVLDAQASANDARAAAEHAIAVLAPLGDDYWLARAWRLIGTAWNLELRNAQMAEAARTALEHARRAGDGRMEIESIFWLSGSWAFGPTPVQEALERCEELRAQAVSRMQEAYIDGVYAHVLGHAGRFDEARERVAAGRTLVGELGDTVTAAGLGLVSAAIELAAGDAAAAEVACAESCAVLRALGGQSFFSTIAAIHAEALYRQDRLDEAEERTRESEEAGASDDLVTQALWRAVRAKVLARRGEHDRAEELARAAVELVSESDAVLHRAEAALALATVLRLGGRDDEARAAAEDAAHLYEGKGARPLLAAARELVAELAPA